MNILIAIFNVSESRNLTMLFVDEEVYCTGSIQVSSSSRVLGNSVVSLT